MIRLETRLVVYAACNNGSSAVVTKEGQLFIFGKDTTFCDQSSGNALTKINILYFSVEIFHAGLLLVNVFHK